MKVTIKPGLWLVMGIVFLLTLGAAFSMWFFLRGQEQRRGQSLLLKAADSLQDRVQAELDQEISTLQRMASKWQLRPDMSRAEWEYDARQILEEHPSLLSLAWVPNPHKASRNIPPIEIIEDWRVSWSLPTVYEPAVIKLHNLVKENRPELLTDLIERRRTRVSDAILVADRGKAFAAYVPSIVDGQLTGAVVGVFHLQVMMDFVFDRLLASDYSVQLMDGYQPIYSRGLPKSNPNDWEQAGSLKIFNSQWKMRLWPNPEIQRANEKLADLFLLGGLALASLLTALVYFAARRPVSKPATIIPDTSEHRRKIEERLRVWEAAISSTDEAIFVVETEKVIGGGTVILFANDAFTRLTGYDASEVIGKSPRILFADDSLRDAISQKTQTESRIPIWHKASVSVDVEMRAKPVLDSQHNTTHWIIAFKKAEELSPSSANLAIERMLADSPLAVQILDAEGKVLHWNPIAESTTGWPAADTVGKATLVPVQFPKEGYWTRQDLRLERRNGNRLDLAVWTAPIQNPDGSPATRYMSFMAELTKEHEAFENLSQSEASFRALVENASDILAILDLDTNLQYINPAVQTLLGLDPAQLIGAPVSTLLHEITPGTDPLRIEMNQHDGGLRQMEATITPIVGTPLTLLAARSLTQPSSLLNSIQDAILTYDTEHRVTWMNHATEALYGFTATAAQGKTLSEIQPDWLQVPSRDQILQALDLDGFWKGEISNFTPSGREIVQDVSIAVTYNEQKQPTGSVAIHRDITARKSDIGALAAEDKAKTLNTLGSTEGLWDWNLRTDEVYFSPRWKEMLGYTDDEITGDLGEWYMLVHPDDLPILRNRITTYLSGQPDHLEVEYRARTRAGHFRWMMTRAMAVRNESGVATRLVGLQTDIHDQKQLDEQLLFEAFHDSVTGLANRALFLDRLNGLLSHPEAPFTVAFLDLEKFARINDQIGTRGGDKALAEAGRRIQDSLPPNSFVARHGSDEFVCIIPNSNPLQLDALSALIRSRLAKPFAFAGKQVQFSARIGFALSTGHTAGQAETLLQAASRGLAKGTSKAEAVSGDFEPNQLRVFYHPIVDLLTGEIGGMEALMRWQHPERGLLTPDQFLPAAEDSGLILELDQSMLRQACEKIVDLNTRFHRIEPLILTVNLSSRHFLSDQATAALEAIILASNIDPNWLRIELNHHAEDVTIEILQRLSQLHVRLNISTTEELPDLSRFAADRVKLPGNLVRGLSTGRNLEKVRAIISMAERQNMQVVAEGVESLEQLAILRELKCHLAQGFYFTQPASATDTERLLACSPRW